MAQNELDNYLWLEDVLGEKQIAWARDRSQKAITQISTHPDFSEIEKKALEFFGTKEKIPYVSIDGEYVYNLWNDDQHVQGLFRRTKIEDYLKENPNWQTIIDLDDLSKKENEKWVFRGLELNDSETLGLLTISPGGSDANIIREFSMTTLDFVAGGFTLPESKGSAHWVDDNSIRLERSFGEGSVTSSGYAKTVREWKRGTSLNEAKIIFEVEYTDMYSYSKIVKTHDHSYAFLGRVIDFYNTEELIFQKGEWIKLLLPTMVQDYGIVENQYIVALKQNWKDYKIGDVIAYDLETHQTEKVFSLESNESLYSMSRCLDGLYVIVDRDVSGSLYKWTLESNKKWSKKQIDMPKNGSIDFLSTDYLHNKFFVGFSSFNQPLTYYYGENFEIKKTVKMAPSFFNHQELKVEQHFVKSLDGTRVPYFLIYKNGLEFNGTNPTILYGYGGFEISLKPTFSNGIGASWVSRGGVYVLSNIRGGGEYGPLWHQSALKENRHKAYEDFFAIAEDLFAKKITSPEHLGAMGGSNGGLLMGVCYTQRPDLFKAINCGVPLLDMHRFHKLLAGASWIAEYGDPEDEKDGAYIRSISPYQKINKEIKNYPVMYLNTSTKDDRVHPGHARKFAARLEEYNLPVYYFENMVGGHAGASNFKESAFKHAMDMCFFWSELK
jgi:prolyl oligopeptidase